MKWHTTLCLKRCVFHICPAVLSRSDSMPWLTMSPCVSLLQTWIIQQMYSEFVWYLGKVFVTCHLLSALQYHILCRLSLRIHSWGETLEEAFEQCAMGMFGYMTDTETVEPIDTVDVESEGEGSTQAPINLFYTCISRAVSRSLELNSAYASFFFTSPKVRTWSLFFSTS